MNIFEPCPIPNQSIARGIQAIGGIGLKICITKSVNVLNLGKIDTPIPNIKARTKANKKPSTTLIKLTAILLNKLPSFKYSRAVSKIATGEGIV